MLPKLISPSESAGLETEADPSFDEKGTTESFSECSQAYLKKVLQNEPTRLKFLFRPELTLSHPVAGFEIQHGTETLTADDGFSLFKGEAPEILKLKTVEVTPAVDGAFSTQVRLMAGLKNRQLNAILKCFWTIADDGTLQLSNLKHLRWEEVTGRISFEDATEAVLGDDPSFQAQLRKGIDHWRPRLMKDFGVDVNGLQGLALGDINGDGLEDLYVAQQGGLPDRLYQRQPDGSLRDVSAEAGVDWMELTRAALFLDLDNDGDQDLALTQAWYFVLLENDGTGKFTKRAEVRSESHLYSIAAADYDLDGNLDLYLCGRDPEAYREVAGRILGEPIPYHDANNGGPNKLLRNLGKWKFQDVTQELGLEQNNRRFSYACSWEDYDLDGDPDLYVANDFGRNNLYRNDGGKFIDVAAELGVEDMSAGMGITWGDFDNDGRRDSYISNMFSSAGNRITFQREFRKGKNQPAYQRHARGNTLFANTEDGFRDVSLSAGVEMGRWDWGAQFADLNNDGWEDLYVGNGFITTEDTGDL
jgi:hypothetical protein